MRPEPDSRRREAPLTRPAALRADAREPLVHSPPMQGQLFGQDFLRHGIRETPPYQQLSDASFATFRAALEAVFADDYLSQIYMSGGRHEDVPDMLLFRDAVAKAAAIDEQREDRRLRHGLAILEAKRWLRALDRADASEAHRPGVPSAQMPRYLSRADAMSDRAVKWGILTNGGTWRLY